MSNLMKIEEVLRLLSVSRTTLHRLVQRQLFPPRRRLLGDRSIYFDKDEVADWMKNSRIVVIK